VVSTLRDPEGRPTVAELVRGVGARVYPVGRLDYATSGVLLMTNDGEFSNALIHPRGSVPKLYVMKVKGVMDEQDAEVWRQGVMLDDGKTLPAEVRILRHEDDKTWLEVVLREGRNQQIRRMGEATGFPVMRLSRLSFAGITSEGLKPGEWRLLTADELMELRKAHGVPKRIRPAMDQASRPRPRPRLTTTTRDDGDRPKVRRTRAGEVEHRDASPSFKRGERPEKARSSQAPQRAGGPRRTRKGM
jgi:23S rRNA pseudouridine2605 synthase